MIFSLLPRPAILCALGLVAVVCTGCVVADGGYDSGPGVWPGYYEPAGGYYGGWGAGYRVGPVRGPGYGARGGGGGRFASGGRGAPGIPSGSRGGGGGGGHGGGGRH